DALGVVVVPMVHGGGKLRFGRKFDHVGSLAEAMDAALLGDLQRCRRIRMLGYDIGALIDQGLGCVALLAGIVPAVDPDDFDLAVGVDRTHALHEGVHPHDDLGNRNRPDIADYAGFGELAGNHALYVAAFVEADVVGRDIVGPLVARGM